MKKYFCGLLSVLVSVAGGCMSAPSMWRSEGPPNQEVQVKEIEVAGGDRNFQGAQVAISDPALVSFSTVGPTERRTPLRTLPAPVLRLAGAQLTYLSPEINRKIQEALNINADPTTMSNEVWQTIKAKYPSLTHLATTVFNASEEWKLSQEEGHGPYIWSSSIIARTVVVDLRTRTTVSEWRQEVADRSTWTDACSSPEELARYLVPVSTTR